MKQLLLICILASINCTLWAQSDIDLLLKEYNQRTVPYISVEQLQENPSQYLILDTRLREEYEVSHIPGAIWVSEKMNEEIYAFAKAKKDIPIVVYCSVGVRSEDFGEQLQEMGFTNVKNLYGSIFAWKDAGCEIQNKNKQVTDSVHTYDKKWAKYLKTGIKITERKLNE